MKRTLVLGLSLTWLAACGEPGAAPADAAGDVDAAPWSPPDVDPPPGLAVTLEPVLDINTQPPPLAAAGYRGHNGKVYFGARRAGGDFALYASDGTAAGTTEIASRPTWTGAPSGLLSHGGRLLFSVGDEVIGAELWATDGTDAGTRVVVDARVGKDSGFPKLIGASGTTVYWVALTARGSRLWRTDGTPSGTSQIGEFSVGEGGWGPSAIVVGDKLYFGSSDGPMGAELYISDGTAAGTRLLKDINPGTASSLPSTFAVVGSKILFSANDGTHGAELWITDGTAAGTVMLADIRPGASGSINRFATQFSVHQGFAYFAADDGVHGAELWRSNGTAAGTTLVADLNPGPETSSPRPSGILGDKLLLTANNAAHGREVFVTTGTAAGTSLLEDVNPGAASSLPSDPTVAGATGYFVADDGVHGFELWRTDGTAAGTSLVIDLLPGGGNGAQLTGGVAIGDRLYVTGTSPTVITAPYVSDGTAAATLALIPTAEAGATAPSTPSPFVVAGDKVFFAATDATHGRELWVRDASGARLVRDVNPGTLTGILGDPVAVGSSVCFVGVDAAHGQELWISDGTESGTRLVKDLNPGPAEGMSAGVAGLPVMSAFDGRFYFFGSDGSPVGRELYATDGTAAGTSLVADLDPAPNNPGVGEYRIGVYNGMLLFNARDADQNGVFRYVPSGNAVVRLTPKALYAEAIAVAAGKVYMSLFTIPSQPSPKPSGIYVTNGTAAGTTQVDARRTSQIFALGTAIGYFADGSIYRSNGTLGSSVWVSDAGPPASYMNPRPVELGGTLYYLGGNGTVGTGLWRTDLTTGGTRLVRALGAGSTHVNGDTPVKLGDYLYFPAGDGPTGTELWRSDGTEAGTQLVRDVWPGPRSSSPRNLVVHGDALYLSLDDGMRGAEPWRLTAP
ncbi:MAG: ELWxxDGT repeat protein [Kofleriaceae bacterium]